MSVFSTSGDLKPSGDGIHAEIGKLTVFNSQFNIGHEVYARWLYRGMFGEDKKKQFPKLNLIFVGPSYSDLREQTTQDIAALATDLKLFGAVPHSELMKHVKGMVFNSSRLKGKLIKDTKKADESDEEDGVESGDEEEISEEVPTKEYDQELNHIPFLTGLKSDVACENLHLIIHDEAHWGIKTGSLLEKFFLRVLCILSEFDCARRPTVLLLLVSATADVLFEPVEDFNTSRTPNNMYAVDWNGLICSGMPQFAVPSYRAVDHLTYINDVTTQVELENQTVLQLVDAICAQRSSCVCQQYKDAAKDFAELIGRSPQSTVRVSMVDERTRSPAHKALSCLLRSYNDEEVIQPVELSGYIFRSPRNKIVLVRVATIDDARELAASVIAIFHQGCGFVPFEVISLGGSDNIADQLSEHGSTYLATKCGKESVVVEKTSRVAVLQHIPTLLIVVKKLQMGERLPATCCYYDVRATYRGSYNKVISGSQTQFVQDVGRLAGHKNKVDMPVVFLALNTDDCDPGSPQRNGRPSPIPSFESTHKLLTPVLRKATKLHSEHKMNERIYTKMLPFSVLLNASPQIGKTGSFLAVIEIIVKKHIADGAYVPPQPDSETPVKLSRMKLFSFTTDDIGAIDGTFAERCKFLRYLLHTRGIMELRAVMTGDYFKEYHALLKASREENGKNTNDQVVEKILLKLYAELLQQSWKILDCGCGIHGLAPSLNKVMQSGKPRKVQQLTHVYVRGVDLDDAILDCVPDSHKCLTFDPLVSDLLSVPVDEDGYDMVVFNCSLWQQSNFAVLSWANRNLRVGGHLVIVELQRRLPETWREDMLAMGWAVSEQFEDLQYSIFEYDPYVMSVWQKPVNGDLNQDCDLTMVDF